MSKFHPPTPPFIGPAAKISSGNNMPIHRIVIHMTVSPCVPGQAVATANYFKSPSAGGSAQYVVDPTATVQCVGDSQIAQHAPPNPHSIGIEVCGYPTTNVVAARAMWLTKNYRMALRRASYLTAQLALAYDVPVKFLNVGMGYEEKGITTHNNVSQTFHQSVHWDPGSWPKQRFMRQVRRHVKRMTKNAPK